MSAPLLARSTSTASYLANLDPDELFVKHSIVEIKQIQQRLRNEADAKQEELRQMVGERYRDLLEASTSIVSISESSKRVKDTLENAQAIIRAQEGPPLPKRMTISGSIDVQLQALQLLSAHIKLLLDAPEHLWRLLEKKKYLPAAWLFLLSRVVHRALLRNDEDEDGWWNQNIDIQEEFPIVQRQWEVVSQFRSQILHKATLSLRDFSLTVEDCCATLLALHLLDSRPLSGALKTLLEQRTRALRALLSASVDGKAQNGSAVSDTNTPSTRQVKQSLQTSLSLVSETVGTARRVFMEQDGRSSLLRTVMQDIQSDATDPVDPGTVPPELHLTTQSVLSALPSASYFAHLPPNLKQYKPYIDTASPTTVIQSEILASTLQEWFTSSLREIQTVAEKRFSNVHSVKDLWGIRSLIYEWLATLKSLEENEAQSLRGALDHLCCQRILHIWEAMLGKAQQDLRTRIPENVAASSRTSLPPYEKSPVANLFHPPFLPTLPSKLGVATNDPPFAKYQASIHDRLGGRTALLDGILRILETCIKSLQQDLAMISAGNTPEALSIIRGLTSKFQPNVETLCSHLITVVTLSTDTVRDEDTDSLLYLIHLTNKLACSPVFPSTIFCTEGTAADFRSNMQRICDVLADRWRRHVVGRIVETTSLPGTRFSNLSSPPSGPSTALLQALIGLARAVQGFALSKCEVENTNKTIHFFIEQFAVKIGTETDQAVQRIWDLHFLSLLLEGDSRAQTRQIVRDAYTKLAENEDPSNYKDLEKICAEMLARMQVVFAPLTAPDIPFRSPHALLRLGTAAADAQLNPALNVVKPSSRFGLVLVNEGR